MAATYFVHFQDVTKEGSDHPDIDINNLPAASSEAYYEKLQFVVGSSNETQFKK